MTELEEYLQTGMLGEYKPELIRGTEACGKIIPHYGDEVGVCSSKSTRGKRVSPTRSSFTTTDTWAQIFEDPAGKKSWS